MALQAEPGDEQRRPATRVVAGQTVDDGGRHAGDGGDALDGIVAQAIQVALEARARGCSRNAVVVQAGVDDDPAPCRAPAPRRCRASAAGGRRPRPSCRCCAGSISATTAPRSCASWIHRIWWTFVSAGLCPHSRMKRLSERVARVAVEIRAVGQPRGLEARRPAEVAVGQRAPAELVPERHGQAAERAVAARRLVVQDRLRAIEPARRVQTRGDVRRARRPSETRSNDPSCRRLCGCSSRASAW